MINWKKVNPNLFYQVEWLDIQSHSNIKIKKPYSQYLAPSVTIGKIKKEKDTVLVVYGWNEDEICCDAIPVKVITNIIKL